MAERQINIKVENLVPILQGGCDEIVCGNGTYTVLFDFDEEWAGLNTKTAIFVCGDTPLYSVFEGNICKVPEIDGGTVCYVGVVSGSIEDINAKADKRTTVWCCVKAKPSITSIAKEPLPPSQDVYVQFMALLNKYIAGGGGGGGGGEAGFSPTISITEIDGGHRITITDITGTKSFDVLNGKDGKIGSDGENGVSPICTVTAIENGHRITIVDASGTKTFDVFNGDKGDKGDKGDDYILTEEDKTEIVNSLLEPIPNGDEVLY